MHFQNGLRFFFACVALSCVLVPFVVGRISLAKLFTASKISKYGIKPSFEFSSVANIGYYRSYKHREQSFYWSAALFSSFTWPYWWASIRFQCLPMGTFIMEAQVSCMKRLSLQLCQRGTRDICGGKQEGITSQYMLLHKQCLRASISRAN